ncbi:hypothetical protein AYO41_05220 [Verrucomicrobia bacterium SCGC AG-212-E04]|nr:hypothetical protein AYO41_05220 [Verrucomicrobia bacterium SCGC AG-212-E04]
MVLVDAPGHEEFLKNMVTGAASADAAMLLVAADEGWGEQSRRHAYLLGFLGLRQVKVIVNKLDRVDYSEDAFRKLEEEGQVFLKSIGIAAEAFIPVSAREGENVVAPSDAMKWHGGPSVLSAIDSFQPPLLLDDQPLRFAVQDVYRHEDRRIVAGRVESGTLRRGDQIVFWPYCKAATVASIERWPQSVELARPGDSIGITLEQAAFVERGSIASHRAVSPVVSNRLHGSLFWLGQQDLIVGTNCRVKLATQDVMARVSAIDRIFDPGRASAAGGSTSGNLPRHGAAEVTLELRAPLVFDRHDRIAATGRFVLEIDHEIAGGGIVTQGDYPGERRELKSANVSESRGSITTADRAARHGHRGAVVWLTGLSGAGKSTIARALERELFARGMLVGVLDGDNLRGGLNSDLGFAPADRIENIRRAAEVARLLAEFGTIVIVALISPYRVDRAQARRIALEGGSDFIEVYIDAPLEVCEQRDPKQLYRKARAGLIKEFTGIDAPYESPEDPEMVIHTDRSNLVESTDQLLEFLLPRLDVSNGPARPN